MKELYRFRQFLTEGVIKENTEEEIKAILSKSYPGAYSEDDFEEIINLYNTKYKDYKDSYGKLDGVEQSAFKFNYANNRDIMTGMKAGSKSSPSITSPEMGGELKAPSGWTEIKDLSDLHRSEEDDEIAVKAWDAPMEGWDEKNKDIIVVRKEDDKFYLDGYIPFGSFDEQGPFDTYEEALKLAVEEMEAFKEDWDEDLSEGVVKEDYKNDYANSEEDFTDEMVVQKIKDIIKYHELDPQDLIDEIRIEFGVDAMD